MKSTNNKILLLTALMMTSLSAFALKDDTNKPINIVSDNQSLDMENSVVTFTDNVVITQGSILIKANKVVQQFHWSLPLNSHQKPLFGSCSFLREIQLVIQTSVIFYLFVVIGLELRRFVHVIFHYHWLLTVVFSHHK